VVAEARSGEAEMEVEMLVGDEDPQVGRARMEI